MYAPYSFQFSISAAFCTARCFFSKGCVCLVYTSWPKEWHLTRTSNPCYSLVINKAHIVVEGNWEDKLRLGGDSFHLSVHAFWKMYWLTIRTEEGKYGQISADFSESQTESFLPQQAALYCFVFHIHLHSASPLYTPTPFQDLQINSCLQITLKITCCT